MPELRLFAFRIAVLSCIVAAGVTTRAEASSITLAAPVSSVGLGPVGGTASCQPANPCSSSTASSLISNSVMGSGPYTGSGTASTFGFPPELDASISLQAAQLASGEGSVLFSGAAISGLTYYLELAQTAGTPYAGAVPVTFDGTTSVTSQASGVADFNGTGLPFVDDPNDFYTATTDVQVEGLGVDYTNSGTGSYSPTLDLEPGIIYQVTLSAYVSDTILASLLNPISMSVDASIDPTFTISPDYASDFELVFSPGIGNNAIATPEPSTWPVILIGLAALIVARHRLFSRSILWRRSNASQ